MRLCKVFGLRQVVSRVHERQFADLKDTESAAALFEAWSALGDVEQEESNSNPGTFIALGPSIAGSQGRFG